MTFSASSSGYAVTNSAGRMTKYLATSLAIENMVRARRVISRRLAALITVHELQRVAVKVDHVARLACRRRAEVQGDADIRLSQRWRVVGAVPAHGHEPALSLLIANQLQLGFGASLRHEVVHAGLGGYGRSCQRIVASDHDRPDAHRTQLREAGRGDRA